MKEIDEETSWNERKESEIIFIVYIYAVKPLD